MSGDRLQHWNPRGGPRPGVAMIHETLAVKARAGSDPFAPCFFAWVPLAGFLQKPRSVRNENVGHHFLHSTCVPIVLCALVLFSRVRSPAQ